MSEIRILLAPDSFKGSLSAIEVCAALQLGATRAVGNRAIFEAVPLADGGEGTLDCVLQSVGGQDIAAPVFDPLNREITALWAKLSDGAAFIEMAQASGLTLVAPDERSASQASSFGTGQLMRAALDAGCRDLSIGIGGSATTDGGAGALQALGARLLDARERELPSGGAALIHLARIDLSNLDARLRDCRLEVLCDVSNPLCGANGAAHIYGPQKGASANEVLQLDAALKHFADVAAQTFGFDRRDQAGAGAAGGIGWGLMSFCGARLVSGIDKVLSLADFDTKLNRAVLVLTGEGSIDAQTLRGKVLCGVARRARQAKNNRGVPVIAFGGAVKLSTPELDELGLTSAFSIADGPLSLNECFERADELVANVAERALRLWLAAQTRN